MEPRTSGIEEGHLSDHLSVLRRRWRTAAAAFVGFLAVATAFNLRVPPVYESTVRIVIGAGFGQGLLPDRMNPMEGYLLERRSFETQLEVIRSEPVANLAAEALGWIGPEADRDRREAVAARIKGGVSVRHLRDTRIVLLSARSDSPEAARDLAEAVAAAYIEFAREEGTAARTRSIEWLTREIETLRERIRESDQRLVEYLDRDPEVAGVSEVPQPDVPSQAEDAIATQLAQAELELAELLGRYRSRHPQVLEARNSVEGLKRRLAAERERQSGAFEIRSQYRLLRREADLDHQLYEVLLKKLKETDVSAGVGEADIRILEHAKVPGAPVAPRTVRNLCVAALLALCAGLMLAYTIEYFDRSVGSAEEVQRVLGLPTLAAVTRFRGGERRDRLAAEARGSQEAEAFRTLRTNLRFAHVDMPRRVVLVTSTGPAEGKSTVVANLAVSLAQSGRRVVIVETDLRRPVLHRAFAFSRSRGLADVLAGDASLEQAVRETRTAGLSVIPCGTLPANPAELIESVRLQELIGTLREQYDYVLLDSPPAAGLVDASLLSPLADGVLFVVEPRRFDWRVLRAAVRQLERGGARIYGVVLNKAGEADSGPLFAYYGYGPEAEAGDATPAGAA